MTSKIRIAIQKSGRLSEASLALIKECGIDFGGTGTGKLKADASNFPAEILFLRDDDILDFEREEDDQRTDVENEKRKRKRKQDK